jgi:ribonuclease HII
MSILGIDEVGRGCWAGPLVVGAVVLPDDFDVTGLADSKQLTARQREQLNARLAPPQPHIGLGWVPADELDIIGLSAALRLATRRAVEQITAPFHEIIIDGTVNFLSDTRLAKFVTTTPKADALIPAVSAASIVAKVARDHYMVEQASAYPDYHFNRHVGYGTALHRQALVSHGITPLHRRSFKPIADLIGSPSDQPKDRQPTTGTIAESKVATHLESLGHRILARNWCTKSVEIDIISIKSNQIYFTEVKYRSTVTRGSGLDAITPAKLRQMRLGAQQYLHAHRLDKHPILQAVAVHGPDFVIADIVGII